MESILALAKVLNRSCTRRSNPQTLRQHWWPARVQILRRRLPAIENEIGRLDSHLPVFDAKSLDEHLSLALFPMRIAAAALVSFGGLALALAAIGLYGTTSYSVAQRTQEMGIRMALGAEASDLLKLILRQGMLVALVGMAIGGVGSASPFSDYVSLAHGCKRRKSCVPFRDFAIARPGNFRRLYFSCSSRHQG